MKIETMKLKKPTRISSPTLDRYFKPNKKIVSKVISSPRNIFLHANICNGVFETKIRYIEITKQGEKKLKNILYKSRGNLRVIWSFMCFPPSATQQFTYTGNKIKIDYTISYEVCVNDTFLQSLFTTPLSFKLFLIDNNRDIFIGRGEISLQEVLNNPNEKIDATVEISNLDEVLQKNNPLLLRTFAKLYLTFHLKCSTSSICKLMMKRYDAAYLNSFMSTLIDHLEPEEEEEEEEQEEQEDVFYIRRPSMDFKQKLMKNKKLIREDYPSSFNEVKEIPKKRSAQAYKNLLVRARKKHSIVNYFAKLEEQVIEEVSDLKRSLEEYAILSGYRADIINSPSWRQKHLQMIPFRKYPAKQKKYVPQVYVHIHELKFNDSSPFWKSETVKQFHVEFTFLSHCGETWRSQGVNRNSKNVSLKFNFKKTFVLDPEINIGDCRTVANMIKQKRSIIIEVISEPYERFREVQGSEIIGYCQVDLFDLIQLEENVLKAKFEVKSFKNPVEEVGILGITFGGIQVLRNVALNILKCS